MYIDTHSSLGDFDYPNDQKQVKLTLALTALMSIITVMLIVAAVLSPAA